MHAMAQSELSGPTTDLATRSRRDGALDAALERLAPGRMPERPDTPDRHVTAVRRLPAVAARYAPFPEALDERLRRALASRGISQFYTHQAEAIDHALAGRHTVVITPTASGKTLCYNAPVLDAILKDPSSRALYLFPTKALAQEQLAELQAMCEQIDQATGEKIGVHTYDGDTPQDARRPALVPGRNAPRRVRIPEAQPAAHRVCAEPSFHGNSDDVLEGRLRGNSRSAGTDSRVSRRLPADAAPRNRERTARRRRARRR